MNQAATNFVLQYNNMNCVLLKSPKTIKDNRQVILIFVVRWIMLITDSLNDTSISHHNTERITLLAFHPTSTFFSKTKFYPVFFQMLRRNKSKLCSVVSCTVKIHGKLGVTRNVVAAKMLFIFLKFALMAVFLLRDVCFTQGLIDYFLTICRLFSVFSLHVSWSFHVLQVYGLRLRKRPMIQRTLWLVQTPG